MKIISLLWWDHLSSKFGAPHPYFVSWAAIFKTSKRFKHRLLDLKINWGWSEHPGLWWGFGNFFMWSIDRKSDQLFSTHLESKQNWSIFKLCLVFAPPEHDMRGCFSALPAEKTNGWSERTISSALMANWKKCVKTVGCMSRASIPFTPHLPWDSLWWKALHCSE